MPDQLAPYSQVMLRLPETLHEKLEAQAEANHRSLNAEILARLEASLAGKVDEGLIFNDVTMRARMQRMEELAEQSTTATDA